MTILRQADYPSFSNEFCMADVPHGDKRSKYHVSDWIAPESVP